MAYPSIITSFSYPTPSNRLNNPSHSSLENLQSSTIGQIEAFIGTDASVQGTLVYDIRSPLSNGGGHIQTAVTGGTGQTTFNKGDILVATSPSVLSKLAAGQDGQALVYNSSLASGLGPATPGGVKIFATASVIGVQNIEASIFSVVIPGSTLGTNNAVKATSFVNFFQMNGIVASVKALYGGNVISSVTLNQVGNVNTSMMGEIRYTLIGNQATNQQRVILQVSLLPNKINAFANTNVSSLIAFYGMSTSSVESSANQTMGLTIINNNSGSDVLKVDATIIEKIQ